MGTGQDSDPTLVEGFYVGTVPVTVRLLAEVMADNINGISENPGSNQDLESIVDIVKYLKTNP